MEVHATTPNISCCAAMQFNITLLFSGLLPLIV